MTQIQILHLEDSPLDAELIRVRLAKDGLPIQVRRVTGPADYTEAIHSGRFDVVLADHSLPGFDGLKALEIARQAIPDTPFLFVSGVLGEEVAIETLRQGATDYVLKHRLDRLGPAVRRALAEARDRLDRRKAEATLRDRERMHRLTLDSIRGHAILTISTEGRITTANAGASGVLGYTDGELIGRPSAILFTADDVESGLPEAELAVARRRGISEDERWHVRKDGGRFWGSGLVTPMIDESGELTGFTKVIRDMTEWKRAEEALREADRRKDEFLAMLAHELRNPLSSIHNAAQLVRHPAVPLDKAAWAKDMILSQVKHLARLVDDLLDVARITRDKIRLRPETLDLAAILRRAADVARPMIADRKHELVERFDAEGPTTLVGDPTRIEQVFVNLLTNAAKYTDPGGRIDLSLTREGGWLVVRVKDSGVGISPEMMARVFEMFAQVDRSLDRSQGGLGIGLTISRRLVELHGGKIEVSSEGAGLGSQFTVRFPSADAEAAEVIVDRRAGQPRAQKVGTGERVLVVDDNLSTASALAELLQMSGYDVHSAHDGQEAIVAAREHRPRFVLLDIGLPGMDGYQVAECLRNQDFLHDATLIAITGYGEEQARRRSKEAGFDHHLVKPVDYDNLLDLLAVAPAPGPPSA